MVRNGQDTGCVKSLAGAIEVYLKRLLAAAPGGAVLLQRKELAARFHCVPSQINYVLSTRFVPEKGYLVESRRGGGGYLRIRKLELSREKAECLLALRRELNREEVSCRELAGVIGRLEDAGLVTNREGLIMQAAILREGCLAGEASARRCRAAALACMLEILFREQ
jgi:transcriptional regulator CtsR